MRHFYIIVAIAALSLAACNNEADSRWESWMDNVPGLENNKDPETGESYTSYMGHPMPLAEDTYNRMMGFRMYFLHANPNMDSYHTLQY